MNDAATTLRWYITNRWGDPGSHPDALRLIDDIVGYPAPGQSTTPPPAMTSPPEPPIYGKAPTKVALVVGHNSAAKGAYAVAPIEQFEYDYNNALASHILDLASTARDLEFRRFLRTAGGGYSEEIDRCYRDVNQWDPALVVEMHFNGGGGDYACMLYANPSFCFCRKK